MIVLTKLFRMPRPRGTGRSIVRTMALTAGAVVLFGCHLLDVTNPDVVPAGLLNSAGALPTIRAGAIGDFGLAWVGSGASGSGGSVEGQVLASGTLSDELMNTETFPDRVQADARQVDPASGTFATVFQNLSRARASAEGAAAKFRQFSDTTANSGLTEMLSLSGFTYVMFAENYCSGVPISNFDPVQNKVIYGVPLNTAQLLDTAINRFNQALIAAGALTSAGTKASFQQMANVGLARANLDLGNIGPADAAAALVTTGYAYIMSFDKNTVRENNGIFAGTAFYKRYGIADKKGIVGIPWRSSPDPRTTFYRDTVGGKAVNGLDGLTAQFNGFRYPERDASVPLATGLEARLINAEHSLSTGDTVTFMGTLNALRATIPSYIQAGTPAVKTVDQPLTAGSLAALTTPTSDTAAIDLLFNERARWLWLTAHRLNDMRRLVRPIGTRGGYGFAPNSVWPNGAYFKNGLVYGSDYNYPVPQLEQNNPNFTQCLDRLP
ncbi:MAG TPA: hypothetical protein VN674_13515 [Gemmatimonadales bacterium]|nr:hypothetical protein [Gemmatimonadales bacterium]